MLRKILLHLPLAVMLGLTAAPAPALAHVPGEVQLMTPGPGPAAEHTIRHAAGNWDRFNQLGTGGWEVPLDMATAIVNGELNLVHASRYPVRPFAHYTYLRIRHADGTWSPATPTTFLSTQFTASTVDVARVGADLHAVINATDGGLYHAIRRSNGSWTGWGNVGGETGVPGVIDSAAVTASRNTLHLAVATAAGGLFHAIRFADGTWQRFGDVKGAAGDVYAYEVTIAGE